MENQLYDGLEKMYEGVINVLYGISTFDDCGDYVRDVINGGVSDGYTLEKYFFQDSLDEEMDVWMSCLHDTSSYYGLNLQYVKNNYSSVKMMVTGLDLIIEGLSLINKLVKEDNSLKHELKSIISVDLEDTQQRDFNIFKSYGFSSLERKLRGFSQAFNKELKDVLGKYQYYKLIK